MRDKQKALDGADQRTTAAGLLKEAHDIRTEDERLNRIMGEHGAALLTDGARVLTHCNAGALATAGHGTALGVIRSAVASGKNIKVFADETRPFLQGARLTAWELAQDGIPATLIADSAAGHLMSRERNRRGDRGRRPRGGQRRRRQQDRNLHRRGARAAPRHSVLRGLPAVDGGSRHRVRRGYPDRGARRGRSDRLRRTCAGLPTASRRAIRSST